MIKAHHASEHRSLDTAKVFKSETVAVDADLGLVFGWGMICTENGEDHFDSQGDHICEKVMVDSSSDFMINSRATKVMHEGEEIGTVVHSFPLTADIAKAMGLTTDKTGWMVATKPPADVLKKYDDGTFTGFSVGGLCTYVEEAA